MNETQKSQSPRRRSRSRSRGRDNKPIRVWCPGSYDFLHYGPANFLRRVKRDMSTRFPNVHIVAGVYSDEDLISLGRKPVFSIDERSLMLKANKWVDDIVENASMELSKQCLKAHACDYAFLMGQIENLNLESDEHWNDLTECGLLKLICPSKHDPCIASADIINRILLLEPRDDNNNTQSGRTWDPPKLTFPYSISCKELLRFRTGNIPKSTDKIVYVDGSFDVFHPGHVSLLEKAYALGNFLYVGLHSDKSISKYTGGVGFPVMQWNERVMALLACKYVSEIVLDAPIDLNESIFDALSINCVVPSIDDYGDCGFVHKEQFDDRGNLINDRYWVAKKRGIFHEIHLDQGHVADMRSGVTISKILSRVHKNWKAYTYAAEAEMNSKSESCVDHDANKKEIKEMESVTLAQTDCEPELTNSIENGCGNCGCGETLAFQ